MKQPVASKVKASTIAGATAAVSFGALSVFGPEYYTRVPPGMEAGTAVLIGTIFAYFKQEKAYGQG